MIEWGRALTHWGRVAARGDLQQNDGVTEETAEVT